MEIGEGGYSERFYMEIGEGILFKGYLSTIYECAHKKRDSFLRIYYWEKVKASTDELVFHRWML